MSSGDGNEEVRKITANVESSIPFKEVPKPNLKIDFTWAIRRILLTLMDSSIRLIAAGEDGISVFNQIFYQLESRFQPRHNPHSVKQLQDMGFDGAEIDVALQRTNDVNEAAGWLSENARVPSKAGCSSKQHTLLTEKEVALLSDQTKDPAKVIINKYNEYRIRHFKPDIKLKTALVAKGFEENYVIQTLQYSCNIESATKEFILGNRLCADQVHVPLVKECPMMKAIMECPVIVMSLVKPKTLFALMVMCESPNNTNMWLSDPDTHGMVSQVMKIYHAEKYQINALGTPNVQ